MKRTLRQCLWCMLMFLFLVGCNEASDAVESNISDSEKVNQIEKHELEEQDDLEDPNKLKEGIEEEAELSLSKKINLILYGQEEQIYPIEPLEDGLLGSLSKVMNNSGYGVDRPEEFFTEEAWNSNALQYLIENGVFHQRPMPYPTRIELINDSKIRGFLFIDILTSNIFGAKPTMLYFVAEEIEGSWTFTHFGRLQIMGIISDQNGLPYPEEIRNRGDILLIVD